ncbi:hypothetical protein BFJ68_g13596 [Fusarium oxysporum]|uniref:Uncharacterized protein n=1 Tax=Fusarium oxysporum TaxID=5507 RepID=A0A420Q177_FUSOX|nr:hypothetical protein BFJ68_g13596 [Fusarium oxysporum]
MKLVVVLSIISSVLAAAYSDPAARLDNGLFTRQDEGEAVCANCKYSVTCNGVKVNCSGKRAAAPHFFKRQQEQEIRNVCNNCKNNVICNGKRIDCS